MTFPLKSVLLATFLTMNILSLVSCADSDSNKKDEKVVIAEEKPKVSIMAYNVENLFDTLQDADREDYTYLPLEYKKNHPDVIANCNLMPEGFYKQECLTMDWNQTIVDLKISRVADTILSATADSNGPDIVIIEEIENLNALQMLAKAMPSAKYQTVVLLEGEDRRGIDVGVLSRLPLLDSRITMLKNIRGTRGIMEATLKLPNDDKLTVLGFHFPSQSNPVENRIDAVNTLNEVRDRLGPDALVIAGGDSNITPQEDEKQGLRTTMMKDRWSISHQIGCAGCQGTHYYKKEWQFLDILAFSNALTNGKGSYRLVPESIRIPMGGKYQLFADKTPARFDATKPVGVSDHMPIYGEIQLK